MERQRKGENIVLHVTRHIAQAMDVAIKRSVKLFLQWAGLTPVLFSTFQHGDRSIMKTAGGTKASVSMALDSRGMHTAPTSQTTFKYFASFTFLSYHIYNIIYLNVPHITAVNVSQAGLKCVRWMSECYDNVVQVSLIMSIYGTGTSILFFLFIVYSWL